MKKYVYRGMTGRQRRNSATPGETIGLAVDGHCASGDGSVPMRVSVSQILGVGFPFERESPNRMCQIQSIDAKRKRGK